MIIYRDCKRPRATSHRCPAWIVGALNLQRQEDPEGDFVGFWDPLYTDLAQVAPTATWHDIGDDWQVCQVGELVPAVLLRSEHDRPQLLPVPDSAGRAWHAPAVLMPPTDGAPARGVGTVAIPLGFARSADGTWGRNPTPAQARLIAAAQAARAEIVAGTIGSVPLTVVTEWALPMTTAIYHLNDATIAVLGLYDDRLVLQTLLASAGCIPPQAAVA